MAQEVKTKEVQRKRRWRRGYTRVSRKNQATIPVDAMRKAGIQPGDELKAEAEGNGRIVLTKKPDRHFALAGSGRGDGTSIADIPEEELLKGFGEDSMGE
jgi:bifunctional DNA-binding transcriptional regulator/antitoxin component of YhaV-PrlF toxin-antitoxin module